jgi:tyrosyl-tRNA synthetase
MGAFFAFGKHGGNRQKQKGGTMETGKQIGIIEKGCDELVGREHLAERLEAGAVLRVKFGMDPTAPDLHLGHAVVLRKLRQMQDLGHLAVIVLGDATACIGDPTGRSKTRKPMSHEAVLANAVTYREQLFRILDPQRTEIRFNTEWLNALAFEEVLKLLAMSTVAQMLEREDFKNRFGAQEAIGLHEFLYPLMQGYDSVALRADLELGGTDQRFNILMGRTVQRHCGQEPQAALFMPLLEGTDGLEKMSKSLGNHIGIFEKPDVMFEKLMSLPDNLILRYFLLCTDEPPDRVAKWEDFLDEGGNPRDAKLELASVVTSLYAGAEEAALAGERFRRVFHEGGEPGEMPELKLWLAQVKNGTEARLAGAKPETGLPDEMDMPGFPSGTPESGTVVVDPLSVLVLSGLAGSRGDARRLIRQGGVRIRGEILKAEGPVAVRHGDVVRCGRKGFVRLIG